MVQCRAMTNFSPRRIVVIGTTGSGKTTLAGMLAARLHLPHVELDALHWEPNWAEAPIEVFRARAQAALASSGWVVDGNYAVCRDLVWSRAEAVVWLDYPFFLILGRLLRRIWLRWRTKELLWGKNYESLWVHFKLWSDDSLVKWLLKTYWRRRREYPLLFAQPEYSHLHIIRFQSPRQTEAWLQSIPQR